MPGFGFRLTLRGWGAIVAGPFSRRRCWGTLLTDTPNTSGAILLLSSIALAANQSFTNLNAGAELVFEVLNLAVRSLTFRGAGTNLLAGQVVDTAGGGSLTNAGTGVLLLIASNSF